MVMNSITRCSRLAVALAGLLFAGAGLAIWIAPAQAAGRFGPEAAASAGAVSLRADLGGLFIGLALICAMAWCNRSRAWALAAAALLTAIAAGRLIGWIAAPAPTRDGLDLAIELAAAAALIVSTRTAAVQVQSRTRWTRRAIAVAVMVVAAAASMAMLNPRVQESLFERAARERAATINTAPLADDALRVAVCGSSAPLPSAKRAKPCVAVFAGGRFYVVDVGPESVENLSLWGIPMSAIGGVLLTHFHSDHIGDLGELNLQTWAGGRPEPLTVYGGPGVERVVDGFNTAYRMDQGYRTTHHTPRVMPPATWPMIAQPVQLNGEPTGAKDRTGLVFERDGLRVTAIEVDHAPIAPAYAYRFDYKGRSVVITGDMKYHPPLANAARGADVIVSEGISITMTQALGAGAKDGGRPQTAAIMHDIQDYHVTPEQAARIANDAGARLLVFYHLLPSPDGYIARQIFGRGVNQVRQGEWTIADDGSLYTLPIGSAAVRIGRIGN
jgi:ribonuclease Z